MKKRKTMSVTISNYVATQNFRGKRNGLGRGEKRRKGRSKKRDKKRRGKGETGKGGETAGVAFSRRNKSMTAMT